MSRYLVDSSVLLDILTVDPVWYPWSSSMIRDYGDEHVLAINPIIYAEISVRFARIEDLEAALPKGYIERLTLPWQAAFLAGKCFLRYRRSGGTRTAPLPDFFIGAHAAVEKMGLITRDPSRFRAHFPTVPLITPDLK